MSGDDRRADLDVIGLLDDEYARAILTATSLEPMSAKALCEAYGMSRATASRRLDALTRHGLVAEQTHLDPDGHHYSEYEARLDRVTVTLDRGELEVSVDVEEDAADRFTRLWREMREH